MIFDITQQTVRVEYLDKPNNYRDITFSNTPLIDGIKEILS